MITISIFSNNHSLSSTEIQINKEKTKNPIHTNYNLHKREKIYDRHENSVHFTKYFRNCRLV